MKLRFKLTSLYLAIVFSFFLLLWIANNFALAKYYTEQKVKNCESAYAVIDKEVKEDDLISLAETLQLYSEQYNISIAIVDSVTNKPIITSERDGEMLLESMREILFSGQTDLAVTVKQTDNYSISYGKDEAGRDNTIRLFGYCSDNSTMVLMSSPLENIKESVKLSNRFLIIAGLIFLLAGAIISFVLADKIQMLINRLQATNVKLQSDLDEKEKQEKQRIDFISNVSHELKTPIALIQGYAEGLQDGLCEDEESRKYYSEVIADEAGKMNVLVKQLLQLSKLESGADKLNLTRFCLSEMVNGIADSSKILMDQKNVSLIKDIDEDVFVEADEYKMESVVSNYLSNAVNHVNEGGVIGVTLKKEKKNAVCRIFNTGKNIPQEDLENIWDKFYKVDKAHTRAYGGSGIGLSIVNAVMKAHGGKCSVVNTNDGVEFSFEIKLAEARK